MKKLPSVKPAKQKPMKMGKKPAKTKAIATGDPAKKMRVLKGKGIF